MNTLRNLTDKPLTVINDSNEEVKLNNIYGIDVVYNSASSEERIKNMKRAKFIKFLNDGRAINDYVNKMDKSHLLFLNLNDDKTYYIDPKYSNTLVVVHQTDSIKMIEQFYLDCFNIVSKTAN